ncbi:MAG TPA: alpha/beta hydrolase-fold protein, partial [Labilithrix sp.]|nr:alpha/beta hydrolase-fold protein [Labilithrix sp.]
MTWEGAPRKFFLRWGRRQLLTALGIGLISRRAAAGGGFDADDDLRNLRLLDLSEGGRRFVLVVPRYLEPAQKLPLVVLLHGLGETTNERLGAYAWVEKYGLGSAWQRLKRAPIERTSKRGEWSDARLAEVNAELAARPFRGLAMACPFMPNPSSPAEVDAYAKWIETSLVPRVRKETQVFEDPDRTYLCGVSLGGYVSLELLARLPHLFGAWAGVQTAIGPFAAPAYAEKIAKGWSGKSHPMLLLTSTQDHWRASSEALAAAFKAKNLAA